MCKIYKEKLKLFVLIYMYKLYFPKIFENKNNNFKINRI